MIRRTLAVLVPLVLVVACSSPSGSGGEESQGGGGGESAAASTAQSAAESAAASTGGGGGGSATNACDLITAEEVATVMGVASTEAESLTGDPSYCNYRSDGTLVAATSFSTQNAEAVFSAWESDGPAVSGIGDKAVFSNSSGTLYFVKGTSIMGITASAPDLAERQELSEQLGAIAAGRL